MARDSSATRNDLIDAGERLYARRGINGTNLLSIAREAGQANKWAVQYHFRDRNGLIEAILESRVACLESRRSDLLRAIGSEPSMMELLDAFLRPLAETVDSYGRHTYARFLMQFMTQFEPWDGVHHPLLRREHTQSAIDRIHDLLVSLTPHLSKKEIDLRINWCLRCFLGMLIDHDNALERHKPALPINYLIGEAIEISAAVLQAPARASRLK